MIKVASVFYHNIYGVTYHTAQYKTPTITIQIFYAIISEIL